MSGWVSQMVSTWPFYRNDVIKWNIFRVTGPLWPVIPWDSPVTRNWMFSFICACTNCSANSRKAGDLGRHRTHYDVILITLRSVKERLWYRNIVIQTISFTIELSLIHSIIRYLERPGTGLCKLGQCHSCRWPGLVHCQAIMQPWWWTYKMDLDDFIYTRAISM